MKRKAIPAAILVLSLIITATVALIAYADDDEIVWEYDSDIKTLYVLGYGPMEDYENSYSAPWNPYLLLSENLVIGNGITHIGAYSFAGAENLQNVQFGEKVESIGEYAFASCSSLNHLEFSENINSIADYSFAYDGVTLKNFTVSAPAGSFALHYIMKNNRTSSNEIKINTEPVKCGEYNVRITVSGGMMAYYPYVPKYDGTFKFYSTGTHDTRCYIYDSNYNQIAYNDDGGDATNFMVSSLSLTAGETYYFGARIMNSSLRGTFKAYLEPVEYTLSGTVFAMNDPTGAASDIVVSEAVIDGVQSDGTYTRTVTSQNSTAQIQAGTINEEITFSPDEDADIVLNMCDTNLDGKVNGRDYAYMKTNSAYSKYKPLFSNFL